MAKEGSEKEQVSKVCNYSTAKQIIRTKFKDVWHKNWKNGNTGRTMYTYVEKPKPKDGINFLNRKDQCTIFQLRTGHTKLNFHLNRFNPQHPPLCRNCNSPYETTTMCFPIIEHARLIFLPFCPECSILLGILDY